eukprot:349961-Chlamydomonas_euryale.AAC.18
MIVKNKISWWAYPAARKWCTSRVQYMQDELDRHTQNGTVELPDTLFVMNAYDKPLCPSGTCAAPLFSFNKPWFKDAPHEGATPALLQPSLPRPLRMSDGSGKKAAHLISAPQTDNAAAAVVSKASAAGQAAASMAYDDVLFPVLNHPFDVLVNFPWQLKKSVAFMRAGIYAAMDAECSRIRLYRLSQTPAGKRTLDVGIYKNRHWRVKASALLYDLLDAAMRHTNSLNLSEM